MFNLSELKNKLNEMGIRPKKSLGQNFLINTDKVDKIVSIAKDTKLQNIVEIGPGLGAITEALNSLGPKRFFLIELDSQFADYWREKNFEIYNEDALKFNWEKELKEDCLLVSNLPYQISSSIVIDSSVYYKKITNMILMFQKEVAIRILAKPKTKDYSLLSVIAQTYWDTELVMELGPKDFYPPPSIASRVLFFTRKNIDITNDKKYLSFIKLAFKQRRKKMIKNLEEGFVKQDLIKAFYEMNLSLDSRAEDLSVDIFQQLFIKMENCN